MEEIIDRLVEARHKARLSLEDLQERTKIPLRQLEHLESYQFDKIGPSVYVRGFIRRYAQEVNVDEFSLWQYEEGKVSVAPSRVQKRKPRQAQFNFAPILRAAAIIALLAIAGFFISRALADYFQSQPPAPPDPPAGHEEPGPVEDPVEVPDPPHSQVVTVEELKADKAEAVYIVHNAQELDVVLSFSGDCWTRITADGDKLAQKTFRKGQVEEVRSLGVLRIRFGAPKFVTVTANGIEIDIPDLQKAFNLEIRLAERTE